MSLSGRSSPRATEPKTRTCETPCRAAIASTVSRRRRNSSRIAIVPISRLQHDLDQIRPRRAQTLGEAAVEPVHVGDPRARYAEAFREADPVDVRVAEIEHVQGLAPRVAGPDI